MDTTEFVKHDTTLDYTSLHYTTRHTGVCVRVRSDLKLDKKDWNFFFNREHGTVRASPFAGQSRPYTRAAGGWLSQP